MSAPDDVGEPEIQQEQQQQDRKGKRRAIIYDPSEQTPLLGGPSSHWTVVSDAEEAQSSRARRRLRTRLVNVFLVSLLLCILGLVVAALLAWSYAAKAAGLTPQDLINNDLVFDGPQKLELHNITEDGGLWVTVHGRLGVDVGDAMGINSDPDDGLLLRWWKKLGRHGVRTLDSVSVELSTIKVVPEIQPLLSLATVDLQPLSVRLSVNPPQDGSWLTPVSVLALVYPTNNASLIKEVLNDAWRKRHVGVLTDVDNILVRGGDITQPANWRTRFHGKLTDVRALLRVSVPSIPGLPEDGPLPDPSQFITLKAFKLESSASRLSISADATLTNPAPESLQFASPPLPFVVSIADNINMASVTAAPFTLTHPNITLHVDGSVLPLRPSALPALSDFLARYLSGEPNRIAIACPAFPGLSLATDFPAPNPRPRVLQNVTIHGMKLKGGNGQFLASGTVFARIVLPKGMHIGLNVSRVLPDVLIFDGEVDAEELAVRPSSPGLPDPLPERAFGRIRPEEWLAASSVREESGGHDGAVYAVSAVVKDVPMEVLPGRRKEFSDFVSKVIFKGDGAIAGLQGSAAVTVQVEGMPLEAHHNHLNLEGLPFQGSVRISKRTLVKGQMENLQRIRDRVFAS